MAETGTVFLDIPQEQHLLQGEHFFVIKDSFPVSPGHCLIVSRDPKADYFDLNKTERHELTELIHQVRACIEQEHSPDGYNIGMNIGECAGQTIMWPHIHFIPRRNGDADHKGGLRHAHPGADHKQYY